MKTIKIWVDDIRLPPDDSWVHSKSVNLTKARIQTYEKKGMKIEIISLDHDSGDYACLGGDYIKVLDWLEENNKSFPIHIHTMNPVGRQNMEAIIRKNNWVEVRHLWN